MAQPVHDMPVTSSGRGLLRKLLAYAVGPAAPAPLADEIHGAVERTARLPPLALPAAFGTLPGFPSELSGFHNRRWRGGVEYTGDVETMLLVRVVQRLAVVAAEK